MGSLKRIFQVYYEILVPQFLKDLCLWYCVFYQITNNQLSLFKSFHSINLVPYFLLDQKHFPKTTWAYIFDDIKRFELDIFYNLFAILFVEYRLMNTHFPLLGFQFITDSIFKTIKTIFYRKCQSLLLIRYLATDRVTLLNIIIDIIRTELYSFKVPDNTCVLIHF